MKIHPKPIDKFDALDRARSDLTPWVFVRAAGLANLLVATPVFAVLSVRALIDHDPKAFEIGLGLGVSLTLVIWAIATVLCLLFLAPRGLRALGRRLVARSRTSLSARSAVWDDWLDSPEPHDR
jgi:hypothetical protein